MTNGQVFGLARIANGGECIVCRETWDWLVANGAIEMVDGEAIPKPNVAFRILSDSWERAKPPSLDTMGVSLHG